MLITPIKPETRRNYTVKLYVSPCVVGCLSVYVCILHQYDTVVNNQFLLCDNQ
jgi:hypothetical protein